MAEPGSAAMSQDITTFPEHEPSTRPDALWRSLVEALPDIVLILDADRTLRFVNKVAPPVVGRVAAGAKVRECLAAACVGPVESAMGLAIDSGEVVRGEAKDGTGLGARWYELLVVPLVAEKTARVEQVLLTIRDVTDRKRALETLEANERRFRALVEHGNDCIVLLDHNESIQYASPALLRSLGYTAEEMRGMSANAIVHPADAPEGDEARAARPGESVLGTVRLRHKNGTWRWHEGMARNLLHDPAVQAYVWNRRDVTERRLREERLAFQAALLAQVSQPVVAVDPAGLVIYWNAAAERVFGWSESEVIGRHSELLLGIRWPAPSGYEAFRGELEAAGTWQGELELTTQGGVPIVAEASMRLQHDGAGVATNVIAVMQDVTERRRLEEQLRQSQKMEAIGLLAGGVAHDFNNLLAVILGFSEMARRQVPPDHPVYAQVAEIHAAAKRGVDLTRKLLAFSRKQIIQRRPLDLAISVEDFARMLERVVGEDVELVVEQDGQPILVRADAVQLEQVLLNLCTNARQAMPHGGTLRLGTRRVRFDEADARRQPWCRAGAFAELAVSDTGMGMDEATQKRLFEPFFTTKADGTGLGLATVYGIVEQHEGFMHVESAAGAGATFFVYLPLEDGDAASYERARRPSDAPATGSELVLIAEDEPAVRSLVASTLAELGYRVIATADGADAVSEYERHAGEVALVILDVVMPRLDARKAFERMRAIRPDVRVVFMTGYAPESTRISELLEGMHTQLLQKPFTAKQLAETVRTAIDD
ncbi:MAG TPA: PAS domain S-box protein [Polyangiaceae bacterium]|nr:PAS domain S-box protein [Polyangiaceae bacterium]